MNLKANTSVIQKRYFIVDYYLVVNINHLTSDPILSLRMSDQFWRLHNIFAQELSSTIITTKMFFQHKKRREKLKDFYPKNCILLAEKIQYFSSLRLSSEVICYEWNGFQFFIPSLHSFKALKDIVFDVVIVFRYIFLYTFDASVFWRKYLKYLSYNNFEPNVDSNKHSVFK